MEKTDLYNLVGERIAARRKTQKLTQAELASLVGVSRPSLANMEKGRQAIALHLLYAFVAALELASISDLIPLVPDEAEAHSLDSRESVQVHTTGNLSPEEEREIINVRRRVLSR